MYNSIVPHSRRKSNIATPKSPQSIKVPVAPTILALILKQHSQWASLFVDRLAKLQLVWLLRDDEESFDSLLQRFTALPQSADVQVGDFQHNLLSLNLIVLQAQANSLFGRLALHNIHERFLRDMALNSLAESSSYAPFNEVRRMLTSLHQPLRFHWVCSAMALRRGLPLETLSRH